MTKHLRTCDFCGERRKDTVSTQYGTTIYKRIICPSCIAELNKHHKLVDGEPVLNDDGTFKD